MTVAWFHCFAGIAGDMALGALLDAGADVGEVRGLVERLPIRPAGRWRLEAVPVLRGGIAATHARVHVDEEAGLERTHADVVSIVEAAGLPERVRERALATFAALAEAEGRIHRRRPADVHFHEVGALDAVVDVVGTCAALEVLGVDEVRASAVAVGTGTVVTAHGRLPNPSPAVVELLGGAGAPVHGHDLDLELTTPTGAALLAATVSGWGPLPAMTVTASGFGAGSRDIDGTPNATQVVLGEPLPARTSHRGQPVTLLEATVDDVTGEVLADAVVALLDAGAHDAWLTPVVMKKGRPGHIVSALADPALASQVAAVLRAATGTLGVRGQVLERWPAARSEAEVFVAGHRVRVKVSPGRVKAEHDDAARVAAATGLPVREVLWRAESAWWSAEGAGTGAGPAAAP